MQHVADDTLEVIHVHLPELAVDDASLRRDQKRSRREHYVAELLGDVSVGIVGDHVGQATYLAHLRDESGFVVGHGDADDGQPLCGQLAVKVYEMRHLHDAGGAARGPEGDEYRFAPEAGDGQLSAVEQRKADFGGGLQSLRDQPQGTDRSERKQNDAREGNFVFGHGVSVVGPRVVAVMVAV